MPLRRHGKRRAAMSEQSKTTKSESEGPDLLSLEPESQRDAPARSRSLTWAALVVGTVAIVAVGLSMLAISVERASLQAEIEQRLTIQSQRKVESMEAWLGARLAETRRLVDSELFRLFAFDVEMAGGGIGQSTSEQDSGLGSESGGFGVPLADQGPYMERLLSEFIQVAGFQHGYLVSRRRATAYLKSGQAPDLRGAQVDLLREALSTGEPRFGPLREGGAPGELIFDFVVPVLPPQAPVAGSDPIAAFLFSLVAGAELIQILSEDPLAAAGERTRLLQAGPERPLEVTPDAAAPLQALLADAEGDGSAELPIGFGERLSVDGETRVYSAGLEVPRSPWLIIQEQEAGAAEASLSTFRTGIWIIAALFAGVLIALFAAFWWRLAGQHSRQLADQYRDFAARIAAQKRLLDSINDSIVEHIGVKRLDGSYRLVNRSMAEALGKSNEEIVGKSDAALYGVELAERFREADRKALESGQPVTLSEQVTLRGETRHVEISKVPLHGDQETSEGTVSVARDVTHEVEERARRQRMIEQMVATLVRAIELRDPYLAGHTRRVSEFAIAVAKALKAAPDEVDTLRIAANLSQVGKLAVPKEVLAKPAKLSPDELALLRRHVDHAAMILKGVDFELPVVETILQMHERIDGEGYPNQLKGDQILHSAQILGLCDWFCARVEPRAHRPEIGPEEALAILAEQSERYAPAMVEALAEAVHSAAGESLLAGVKSQPPGAASSDR